MDTGYGSFDGYKNGSAQFFSSKVDNDWNRAILFAGFTAAANFPAGSGELKLMQSAKCKTQNNIRQLADKIQRNASNFELCSVALNFAF